MRGCPSWAPAMAPPLHHHLLHCWHQPTNQTPLFCKHHSLVSTSHRTDRQTDGVSLGWHYLTAFSLVEAFWECVDAFGMFSTFVRWKCVKRIRQHANVETQRHRQKNKNKVPKVWYYFICRQNMVKEQHVLFSFMFVKSCSQNTQSRVVLIHYKRIKYQVSLIGQECLFGPDSDLRSAMDNSRFQFKMSHWRKSLIYTKAWVVPVYNMKLGFGP